MHTVPVIAVPARTIVQRLLHGGSWNIVGSGAGQACIFLAGVLLANILGPRAFGAYGLLLSTLATLSNIGQLSTGLASTKFIAELRAIRPGQIDVVARECMRIGMMGAMTTAIVMALFAKPVCEEFLKAPELTAPLVISAVTLVALVRSGTMNGILMGVEAFRESALSSVGYGVAYLLFCAAGAWIAGLGGGAVGMAGAGAVRLLLLHRYARKNVQLATVEMNPGQRDPALRSRIVAFIVPASIAGMTTMPAMWLCNAFLARGEQGLQEVAWLSVALGIKNLIVFAPLLLTSVAVVLINDALTKQDRVSVRRVVLANTAVSFAAGALLSLLVYCCSDIVLALYGQAFASARSTLSVALVLACIEILAGSLHTIIVAHAQMWRLLLFVALPRDALVVVLTFMLSPEYGALGAIIAITGAWSVCLVVIGVWTWLLLKGRPATLASV